MRTPRTPALVFALAFASFIAPAATAQQGGDGPPPGLDREQMWFAPTEEDWQKPVLITWQRTWEDALAVARETKKPILICVNMDGEIASEHYAGVRYRRPETAKLYEPYVTVIASVYRHAPRDHDEHGNRIPCPRFGTVTCGEHIAIEPILFEKFFDGKRIAPRHVMVELDGEETYDVYYTWDTDSVFAAIREGIENREITPPPAARGDRPLVERVASKDVADRMAVEQAFAEGDGETRAALLEAAAAQGEDAPVELLRRALHATDAAIVAQARAALAKAGSEEAIDLISEELRQPLDEQQREAFVAALKRIGADSFKARTLAVVHEGLGEQPKAIDVEGWTEAFAGGQTYAAAPVEERWVRGVELKEMSAAQLVELAETQLEGALRRRHEESLVSDRRTIEALLMEARDLAQAAEERAREKETEGFQPWRAAAVIAVAAFELGERDVALARAEEAVKGMPERPESWSSMVVLGLFAERRQEQIRAAVAAKEDLPPEWLADLDAAYAVLARHPHGTDGQAVAHYDLLSWLGAEARAKATLRRAIERFADSTALHERLRARIFRERGIDALEPAYAAMLAEEDAPPALHGHAGYAAHVVAEFHRRRRAFEAAAAAYERALKSYATYAELVPEARESADHYASIALAGQARLALESGKLERAVEKILAAFARSPSSAATPDGLNLTAVDTAKMLRVQLAEKGEDRLARRLEEAMSALDPALLALPPYERAGATQGPPRQRRGERRGERRERGERRDPAERPTDAGEGEASEADARRSGDRELRDR